MTDPRQAIRAALQAFHDQPLDTAGLGLLAALGYSSPRRFSRYTPADFQAQFDSHHNLNLTRALIGDWMALAVLAQITTDEVSPALATASPTFQAAPDDTAIQSFLFIAVELRQETYSRAQLAGLTREINRLFPMPVMALVRHGPFLSLGMVTRRPHRYQPDRDVLDKVTLIRDVVLAQPHRAHLDILAALALPALAAAYPPLTTFEHLQTAWDKTLDTSELNQRFFREYRRLFAAAEATLPAGWDAERRRLYTQRFFNRLLFVVFLERKGWLRLGNRADYLRALFDDYQKHDPDKRPEANFHRKRLNTLFFMGLNYIAGDKRRDPAYQPILDAIGNVPYLNGGLFDEEADDRDGPLFPDEILAAILNELVYRFVFTVTESTPLDVDVAVDPEMLGKIFEELVTGRHESGSYYTPKPVVQFMGREALKAYLTANLPQEDPAALARFVDEASAADLRDPEAVLTALRAVKICDPACGSGAYLLGMLHELLTLRDSLFAARQVDARTVYQRKLEIILGLSLMRAKMPECEVA